MAISPVRGVVASGTLAEVHAALGPPREGDGDDEGDDAVIFVVR